LPNRITLFRIGLVPAFVAAILHYRRIPAGDGEWLRYLAIVIFGLASATDGLDGYIARKRNQITELGAILDAMADKLMLTSAVVVISLRSVGEGFPAFSLPMWYVVLVISRDAILSLGMLVVHMTTGIRIKVRPVVMGKIGAIAQMATILWVLFGIPKASIVYYPGGAATLIAGVIYICHGISQVNSTVRTETTPGG
ncbi:MAG: CDP-alcohol phosphatidyltransferase family protein, partial [Thermoplasmata archaeon]|nr:CDP-alcohol phosphatidyltransferase family protein [Thermoplasmata archaeon]